MLSILVWSVVGFAIGFKMSGGRFSVLVANIRKKIGI